MLWIVNAIVLTRTQLFAITLAVVVTDEVDAQYAAGKLPPLKRVSVVPVALEAMVLGLALASAPVRLGPVIAVLLAIAGTLLAARLLKLR